MKGKKKLLAKILETTRLLDMVSRTPGNTLTIVNYHRIYEDKLSTPFDPSVFGPSVYEFEQQMAFLRENFNLLSENDLINLTHTKQPFFGKNALVTFDDGYRDNYQLALPVLKKHQIPAIFFIPTYNIENSVLGWWDIIAYFVSQTEKKEITLDNERISLLTHEDREAARHRLLTYMKAVAHEKSNDLLDRLSNQCEVAFPPRSAQREQLMGWEQIEEIANTSNLSIGSHTVSHRVLSTINDDDELGELRNSRVFLQQKLSREIHSIAYPVGGYHAFSERTKKNAREAGYTLGFSFNTGTNYGCIADPFDIKRISPSPDLSVYKGNALLPRLFA